MCERCDMLCSHSKGDFFTCEDNMLFSHVKISSFRAKAHLVFHWCLYNKVKYSSLTCQQSVIWPIRSWHQNLVSWMGGIKTVFRLPQAMFFFLFLLCSTWEPVHRLVMHAQWALVTLTSVYWCHKLAIWWQNIGWLMPTVSCNYSNFQVIWN